MAEKKTTAAKTAKTATKKTAAKAETKVAETKATEVKATETKTAAKKPAAKKTTTTVEMFIEFGGVQVSVDEITKNVKKANGTPAKKITVYVKPEESKAYYVADGEEKEMDVYFV